MQPALAWADSSLEKPMNLEQHCWNPVFLLQHAWQLGQGWCNWLQICICHVNRALAFHYWQGRMLTCSKHTVSQRAWLGYHGPPYPRTLSCLHQPNPFHQIPWLEGETFWTKLLCSQAHRAHTRGTAPWPLSFCMIVLLHRDPIRSQRESKTRDMPSNLMQFYWAAHALFSVSATGPWPIRASHCPQRCHFTPSLSHNPT